ncbi:epiplakin [Pelodytes ibericus]
MEHKAAHMEKHTEKHTLQHGKNAEELKVFQSHQASHGIGGHHEMSHGLPPGAHHEALQVVTSGSQHHSMQGISFSSHHETSRSVHSSGHQEISHSVGHQGISRSSGHHEFTRSSGHTEISHSVGHHEASHSGRSNGHHETSHAITNGSHQETVQKIESGDHQEAPQAVEPVKVSCSIAGFLVERTKEKVGIYQALAKKLVSEEVVCALLEAQAATGTIIDPLTNQKLSVGSAVQQGIVGVEFQEKLLSASKAVTGYTLRNETLSLFQAFKKGVIGKNAAVRYLEAQVATGGIIDHASGTRVPLSEAIKLHHIDEDMFKILSGISESAKCYLDPNTQDDSTYQNLLSACIIDVDTGLPVLPLEDTLQGLRKNVTSTQLYKAKIITQALYSDVKQGKQTLEVVGELPEVKQYLHGLGNVSGIYLESTKEKISIFQAIKKNLLDSDLAVQLLEAQAASGFIIDPVRNKTFSVTQAIQEDLVGLELKEKLLTAERAVTGFTDPYTGRQISLFQAIKKELIDKKHGENLLEVQVATGGIIDPIHSFHVPLEVTYSRGLFDKETAQVLCDPIKGPKGFVDPNTNERVSYLELRKRCTIDSETNLYMFPLKLTFQGIRGKVTSDELLDSLVIDKRTFDDLQQGKLSVHDISQQEPVKRSLQGSGCIAGVAVVSTNERKSIYQAMKEHFLMPGTSIALLEAQAATGYLVDPGRNLKFSVDEAVKNSLIGPEFYEKLLSAEKAATGFKDPYSGETLSLHQAIKKGFVVKDHGLHLLEAQFATGGIIDPVKKHRIPEEVAYKRGHMDEETNKILLNATSDAKGFFDPNFKENVTYAKLLERCLVDTQTGLYLVPVFDNTQDALKTPHSFIDYQSKLSLQKVQITMTLGKYKGRLISLWDLLFSDYFTVEQRESLIKLYTTGSHSSEELSNKVVTSINELVSSTKVTFKGIRESITPGQLLDSEIIDKDLFEKLQQGEASAKDVVNIDTVKKYLQGTESIGGLILTDTQEKMSIYQAKRKGFLRPGTSLILLEAQAATGFIVDPAANKKYSVDEALKATVIGPEFYDKLLSAEKAVTGYKDPYTEETISLFQAMNKDLIVKDHGIRLLEAQIATGGIIDPVNSHRIPVEVAYKRGYFDKKMNLILSDPSDDTKGFFDPNTHENLTYLQLKEKCITEPVTNLCLLPLHSKKIQFSINDYVKESFRNLEIFVKYGRYKGQTVSAWILINSEYFTEWKRREIIEKYRLKKATLEQITILIEEELRKWTEICFPALRGQVSMHQLMEYEIIDQELFDQVLQGKMTAEDLMKTEKVQKCLNGSGVLGGVLIQPSNQIIDFHEATKKNILLPSTVLPLLEAQAATGHLINPKNNQKLSVDEALKLGIIDPKIYDKLLSAEEAVTGYKDPYTGDKISLFQAMRKGLVEEKHATQLLEAQLATGGIIDPIHNLHLPDAVATKHGYLNEEMRDKLSSSTDVTKCYYDPTTKQMVTYSELIGRAEKDSTTGVYLFPLPQEFFEVPVNNIFSDEEVRETFKNFRIEERHITLWELIHYGYFTDEERYEFLERYKSKRATLQEVTAEVLQIVKNNEIKKDTHICFQGLRGTIPAVWLLDLGIIGQKTFDELVQGLTTIEAVAQLESVKKALEGTGSISGVFVESTKETISIYEAMKRNLILPANALMLLEAQAATGFLVDPLQNQIHSVDSAVKARLVGPELHETLLTAERAVTGYTDPYTGNKISLGQAIHKDLISHKEGIALLQAQLAVGGVMDPVHCLYIPLQLAFKLGYLDEAMYLSKSTEDMKLYFDPNTKENLTYSQLKERCYKDPQTGRYLLTLSESSALYADAQLIEVLKSAKLNVQSGRFKGQTVSVWDLLNSEYISISKLKELITLYNSSSSEALQEITKIITTIIEETDATSTKIKFKGLRKQVSASDLFQSEVIDKKTLDELNLGKKTIVEVTEMDNVKRYLQGTNCIAGVLIQSTNQKMSIYEAMLKRILRPGTALVLLEAQAATGFIADPVKNQRLSVEEAMTSGLIGHDIYSKLLSAEQAVTGYTDHYTGEKISLFQAMKKQLIVECHGIRLLEAQIATGGIIDPVNSHRVPVEVAYKRGYFNEEMNTILSDPSDDTKGFFDPNTHENLTYLQLVERCIQDPQTGLYLLQVVKKGENYFYFTDKIKEDLGSVKFHMHFGKFSNQTVSIWEVLTSEYITDLKRRELVKLYTMGVLSTDQLISSLITLIQDFEIKTNTVKFKGIRGEVTATALFSADIIDKKTLDDLKEGHKLVEDVAQMYSVQRYLEGTGCIAGITVLPSNETITISDAISRGILQKDVGSMLLEAQAATGYLIDPIKNEKFTTAEALSSGLVNSDLKDVLETAEKAVTGFTDPVNGSKLSLFQATKKGLVNKEHGLSFLEAQIATGGIVDPVSGHRVPLELAYKRDFLDEDTYITISGDIYKKRGFVDPNTHERITYKKLLERCIKDPKTGLFLLQLAKKQTDYFYIDEPTKNILTSTTVHMNAGKFKGLDISLWELLGSSYVTEEKRAELLKIYKTKTSSTLQDIINSIISIIDEKEQSQTDIWFQGLRKQVKASELYNAGIINKETLDTLKQEPQTVTDVAKSDSIRRYLEGTCSIAGVFVPSAKDSSKKEKMSLYDAMLKRVLRPGTALVLLEAQAATGFVVDPIKNKRLSVEEAFSAGLVGHEIYEKLLSAERGVTGYKDPYTGEKISLFQAMKKDLIVKDHGIRLLEAQIATGGIIDPVHSHRVPVEVAYKRGYFDEEMNQILADPSDDTKGFFDPNTHENLTYMQLLERCIQDPDTGLYLLDVKDNKTSPVQSQNLLQSRRIQIAIGHFQGKNVSIWELLNSQYFTAEKREELLKKYSSGSLSIEELITIILTTITETETKAKSTDTTDSVSEDEKIKTLLQSEKVDVFVGDFKGQSVSLWELLNSHYFPEEKRKDILEKSKTLTIQEITTLIITIITETETSKIEKMQKSEVSVETTVLSDRPVHDDEIQKALQSISIKVKKGQFQGQEVSVWDLLYSKYVPEKTRHELLTDYKLTIKDIVDLVSQSIKQRDYERRKSIVEKYNLKEEVYNTIQTVQVEVSFGEFKDQKLSVWDLLNSKYFSEARKKELLEKINSGELNVHELIKIIITIIEETEEKTRKLKFKGLRRQITANELLHSEIIDQGTLTELAQGRKTMEEVTQMSTIKKYLEGTSCIAGVLVPNIKDPSRKEKMSIYDAMLRNFLRRGTALVLLEAQAATGFVIEPVKNLKLSVDEAVEVGVVGHELKAKLLSAEKAVTGYTDPYTGDKISLFQAMQKDLIVREHGIRLLEAQIATGGIIDPVHSHRLPVEVAYKRGYFTEEMNHILSDPSDDTKGFFDPNTHENLTYLQLLQRCVQDPDTGLCMLEMKEKKISTPKAWETSLKSQNVQIKMGQFAGRNISIWELLNSHYFTEITERKQELLRNYQSATITIEEVITTIVTIIEEWEKNKSSQDVKGPITSQIDQESVIQKQETILQSELVSITEGLFQGQKLSVWDLLNSQYFTSSKRQEILQKYASGIITLEEISKLITTIITDTEKSKTIGIIDISPSQLDKTVTGPADDQLHKALSFITVVVELGEFKEQKVSLWEILHSKYISESKRNDQLYKHQVTVDKLKRAILQLIEDPQGKTDQEIRQELELRITEVSVGEFKGQNLSVWFLLHSKYISEEKRKELLEKYRSGAVTEDEILRIIFTIIEETEENIRSLKFEGLRKEVSATELLESNIIDQSTLDELSKGSRTIEQVTQMDSVKRYLKGSNCIAGVFVTSRKDHSQREKMNIYDAMLKRVLRPGTALVLLEAQAATGFVVDPIKNKRLSVEEAFSAGLVGHEIYEKLLSAERGVTGYKDPYTGAKISLFQAMKKDLIVKDHGIRLLEAQIATGGIIDPVHSHRVPVEVAYKRGYFDEEMNQILADPSDDTKGFFDPNTHENLTYMQLLERCIQDPDTGLYLLDVKDNKTSPVQSQNLLQSRRIQIAIGHFQGKNVSIWELLNSQYFTAEKREELLKKYSSGSLSIEELITIILTTITETETKAKSTDTTDSVSEDEKIKTMLQSEKVDVFVGDFKGQSVSLWELLNSHYFPEEKRKDILENSKTLTIQEITTLIITIITETETSKIEKMLKSEVSVETTVLSDRPVHDDEIQKALQSISIKVKKGQFQGQEVSVWDLLYSKYVPDSKRKELLGNYKLTVQDIIELVIQSIKEVEQKTSRAPETKYNLKKEVYNTIQTVQVEVSFGEFKDQKLSVWDLLNSKYFSEARKKELLEKINSGSLKVHELIKIIITIIEESEERSKQLKFKGLRRQITANELLHSEIIDQETLTELSQGHKSLEEVTQMDSVKRYLEGTSCIAGVLVPNIKDPSRKEKMSIYDAMLRNFLRRGTALVLLEAQAATGFVIEPVKNLKLSVDEAVEVGVVGHELKAKLLSAEKAVTGYTDPYTGDKISLFQAMQKDLIVREHGIRLLEAQIATGGIIDPVHSHRLPVEVAYKRGYFTEEMNHILSDPSDDTKGFFDPNTHENLTYLQLLQRCVQDPDTGLCMLEMKEKKISTPKAWETSLKSQNVQIKMGQFAGRNISIWELLNSHYFTEITERKQELLRNYQSATITIEEVITTIVTIIEEWEKNKSSQDVKGPITSQIDQETVIQKQETILQSELVSITEGLFQGQKLSVWDLLNSQYFTSSKRQEILQKYASGIITLEEITKLITTIITDTEKSKTIVTKTETDGTTSTVLPSDVSAHHDDQLRKALGAIGVHVTSRTSQEQMSLWEVLHSEDFPEVKRDDQLNKHQVTVEKLKQVILKLVESTDVKSDKQIQLELELRFTEVSVGEFKGQNLSVWFLLHSKYISEEKRKELLEKYRSGVVTEDEILRIIFTIIEETEEKIRSLKFEGLRKEVSATELLESNIIDQSTLDELSKGSRTIEQVTQMDSVKRYLKGSNCIAGVFVTSRKDPSQREKMNIYDAMLKRVLRPGTALVLLEAQAATGFVIDPIKNKKLSVEEAFSAGLIGHEIYEKLLSAERGVTGYKDPYTGEKISLFQAMKKDLIVRDHGIRLLEAQIATGGIIDPVHSHRVPVEVAYKRGYFDEEMNQILADPSDDTKGFFDPNTHENLTYLQLLQRCVKDSETGLCMLDVNDSKPSAAFKLNQQHQSALQSKTVQVTTGEYQGKEVSIWELLCSKFFSVEKREELLKKYQSGIMTMEELITLTITIISESEKAHSTDGVGFVEKDVTVQKSLQSVHIDISGAGFQERSMSAWDFLHSNYVSDDERKDLVERFKSGTLTVEELLQIIMKILQNRETKTMQHVTTETQIVVEKIEVTSESGESDHWPPEDQLQRALENIPADITGHQHQEPTQEKRVSIWGLLHRQELSEEQRRELLQTCKHTVNEVMRVCTSIIKTSKDTSGPSEAVYIDNEKQKVLEATVMEASLGQFKGQTLYVWDLLHSKYFTTEKRNSILSAYVSGTLTMKDIIRMIMTIIEETEEKYSQLKFKGLRRQVTATELLSSEIIDQKTLTELSQGNKTLEEVTKMDNVKRYLEGTGSIAGVLVPSNKDPLKKEKNSIYKAMWKGILRPGTALVLLEAQAATGFIIDPINNKKLSVDEAVADGVIGKELHAKLLSAERGVTGYKDPYTGEKISLFQAMKKDIIVKDHGIRLMEAQIATGGIIDPVHSHRVPVEVAYKRGYFDEEMNQILADPSDDTKGFFDPNTHENLTYLQLLQRCVKDPETGLCMLELKESRSPLVQIEKTLQTSLEAQIVTLNVGHFQGQNISLWELLTSPQLVEMEKERQELLTKYKSGAITLKDVMTHITVIVQKLEEKRHHESLETVSQQSSTGTEVTTPRNQTQNFLKSVEVDLSVGHHASRRSSLWDLLHSTYFTPEKREELLGKYHSGTLTLEELIRCIITTIIQVEKTDVKVSSHRSVTMKSGNLCQDFPPEPIKKSLQYFTVSIPSQEFPGENVSLWDVLHSKFISEDKRQALLQQYYQSILGVSKILTSSSHCVHETITEKQVKTEDFLKSVTVKVNIGEFYLEGKTHSLWELLHCKYISEAKRKELLEKFESKALDWNEMFRIITTIIKETEERSRALTFKGLRRQVSASELVDSKIIDQNTLVELTHGMKTLDEVNQMDSVKRYLEGSGCIAGVFVTSKTGSSKREKMSIYDAMLKRILRPGTALVLLEAQAATGFIIDPLANKKLAVDEAVAARVVGQELHSKLLSAEKAVTGYNDPITNTKLSLFQAMQKDFIVKDHGIRLLEAQIATGGIIDPVHSHRVPVEVAYQRGYFDEAMNQILSDPTDDTKGFFDPNTHENLTYLQLVQRCVQDPETGLLMLDVTSQ